MLSVDAAETIARGAVLVAGGLGSCLTTSVIGAMVESMFPGSWARLAAQGHRLDMWTWAALRWLARGLLSLLSLVVWRGWRNLAVTYLHAGTHVGHRHHYRGRGRRWVGPGRHRGMA